MPIDVAHANRSLELNALMSDCEGKVVQAVTGSTHLSNEHFPHGRTLFNKAENHHTSREEFLDPISADQSRPFNDLSCHECSAANVFQEQPNFQEDFSKSVEVGYPKAEAGQ